MSLTAGVGSFSLSGNNVQFSSVRRIETQPGQIKAGFNFHYRYIDGYPTFVGSSAGLTYTAAIPSHQAQDLIVVFAVNTTSDTIPVMPSGEGWINAHTSSSSAPNPAGWRIAFKYANSSNEAVGNWFPANRVAVAVYRNARALVGSATEDIQASDSSINYPAPDPVVIGSGGTRLLRFGISYGTNNAGNATTGHSTRISTESVVSSSAPSASIKDLEVDPAGSYPAIATSVGSTTKTVGISLGIGYGTPPLTAETRAFTTTLNGDALARTVLLGSKGYRAELGQVYVTYASRFACSKGAFTTSGSNIDLPRGFFIQAGSEDFNYSLTDSLLPRGLKLFTQKQTYSFSGLSINLPKGYFTTPSTGAFTSSTTNPGTTLAARLAVDRYDFDASAREAELQRAIIDTFPTASLTFSLSQVGIRNITASPPGGAAFREPADTHAGSTSKFVKYNSVSKSRDLGTLDNFYGTFTGEVGSQVGAPTLFFKLNVRGDATLRITKNAVNRFTDQQVSIGILDSNRKPVQIDQIGIGYANDNIATNENESLNALPGGVYYFTVSTSQWQKIPYSVSIQAIRYKEFQGVVQLTMVPTSRFAIAKLLGPSLLSNGTTGTIPANQTIKSSPGQATLTATPQGTLIIPSGVAIMRNATTGRLKQTHRISSIASLTGANVATLSSQSSGGGYGP